VLCVALLAATFLPQTTGGGLVRSIVRPFDPASARFAKSTHQRYWMWKTALRIFPRYPLTGVGQRNFAKCYAEHVPQHRMDPYILRDDGTVYTGFAHAHNLYLNLLVTQGLLGLGTFLWLMFTAFGLAYRTLRDQSDLFTDVLSLAILTALVAFLVLGLFDENFRDSEGILQLWFLLGLLYALPRLGPEPTRNGS
jgi:O-antigen ligase